ncbi:MAG: hypothetical protein ACOC22_00870 [bacterium]
MTKVEKITRKELETILLTMPNSIGSFISVTALTNPQRVKKCRQSGVHIFGIQKISIKTDLLVNSEYAKNVLNQLAREGGQPYDYQAGANTMPLDFSLSANKFCGYFIDSKGVNRGLAIQYRPLEQGLAKEKSRYIYNGKLTPKAQLPDVLAVKYVPKNQGTEKAIYWNKLYVEHIKRIHIGGRHLKVVG